MYFSSRTLIKHSYPVRIMFLITTHRNCLGDLVLSCLIMFVTVWWGIVDFPLCLDLYSALVLLTAAVACQTQIISISSR